jgi:PAS domain S-box-containing protein
LPTKWLQSNRTRGTAHDGAPLTVLVVEDDPDTRDNLCDILELDDHHVEAVGTIAEAASREDWSNVMTVILDGRLPDGTADDFLPRLKQLAPEADVIIATGFADLNGAIAALRHGASDYIIKPINANALRASLQRTAERRRLAQAKARSDLAFRTLIETAPSMTVILDSEGTILYFSPFAEDVTGFRKEEVLGRSYDELFGPAAGKSSRGERAFRDAAPGRPRSYEDSVRCKDGSRRWIVWNVAPLDNEGGQAAVLRVGQDITDRKLAEEALVQEKNFVESLIEQAQAIVLLLDPQGRIVRFNPYLENLTGLHLKDTQGQDWLEAFVHESDRDRTRRAFEVALARGEGGAVASFLADDREREIKWSSKTLRDAEGRPLGALLIGHDVTDLNEAQRKALQAERLAAIGQMMTGLTHESRNALQRSKACLEILALEVEDRPDALDLVRRIERAQDHLQQLYEEVRSYAAPINLRRESCDLRRLWRETWSHLNSLLREKPVRLEELDCNVDLICQVDPFALGQVIRNVFENAIHAVPAGGAIKICSAPIEIEGRPGIRLAFQDNGPGLGPEQRERIFEPFFTTKTKGTGLGMAIAKRIMQSHGGQIEVTDRPGPGAEIVLTLPREPE